MLVVSITVRKKNAKKRAYNPKLVVETPFFVLFFVLVIDLNASWV